MKYIRKALSYVLTTLTLGPLFIFIFFTFIALVGYFYPLASNTFSQFLKFWHIKGTYYSILQILFFFFGLGGLVLLGKCIGKIADLMSGLVWLIIFIVSGSIFYTVLLAIPFKFLPFWLNIILGSLVYTIILITYVFNDQSERNLLKKVKQDSTVDHDAEEQISVERRIRERYRQMLERIQNTDFLYIDKEWLEDKYLKFLDNTNLLSKTTVGGEVKAKILGTSSSANATREYTRVEKGFVVKYEQVLTRLESLGIVHIGIELPMVIPSNPQIVEALLLELGDILKIKTGSKTNRKDLLEIAVAVKRLSNIEQGQYVFISDSFNITEKEDNYIISYAHPVAKVYHSKILLTGDIPKLLIDPKHKSLFQENVNSSLKLTVLGLVTKSTVKTSAANPKISLSLKVVQI